MTCQECMMAVPETKAIHQRIRAVMCQTCLAGERSDEGYWGLAVVSCTVSGLPVEAHIGSCAPTCPLGKHPKQDGLVRYLGIVWLGVPKPLRVIMKPWLRGALPGCGCIRFAKLLWLRIKGHFQGTPHVSDANR